jgi:diguanylate cyclase (GGDEF)-like protein
VVSGSKTLQHNARGQAFIAKWQKLPSLLRTCLVLGTYFLGSYLLDQAAIAFGSSAYVSLWYPPPALDVVLLLVGGLRFLPAVFFAPYVWDLLDLVNPFPTSSLGLFSSTLFFYSLIKVVCFGGVSWLLKRLRFDLRFVRARTVAYFLLLASFFASLFAALLDVLLFTLADNVPIVTKDYLLNVLGFWAGDATGVALLAPPLLILLRPYLPRLTPLPPVPPLSKGVLFERVCQFLLLIFTVWVGYARPSAGLLNYTYAIFFPLMWLGTRGGFVVTAWAVLFFNVLIAVAVTYQLTDPEIVALQFNLMMASYAALLLGAVSSELRYQREKLNHVAYHDTLTGLLNRSGFLNRLEAAKDKAFAIFFLDIDRFKTINDSFGQTVGDAFLLLVSRKLKSILPEGATLARLGADEFAVLLPGAEVARARAFAAEMSQVLATSSRIQGYDIATHASMGIALSLQDYEVGDLLRDAESAMQEAKRQGKARYVVFDIEMQQQLAQKVRLERDLRQALERGEIKVHYQPIVSLSTGETIGAEALMRWQHGALGNISPVAFIPIAEDTGLIVDLSYALLKQALHDLHEFPSSFYLTVNLSVRQLQHPGLVETFAELLQTLGVESRRLVLEVTESSLMTNPDANIETLEQLSALGFRLAMDDFGTGYASLNYLKRLPVDILKIDRSFVKGLPDDEDDATLVTTIMALGQSLELEIVAEGVETHEQEAFLKRYGCQQVQGFLYSKPLPFAEFMTLLNGKAKA